MGLQGKPTADLCDGAGLDVSKLPTSTAVVKLMTHTLRIRSETKTMW